MKYQNKGWNDNKGKHERGQVEDSGRRNDRSRVSESYNNDNNDNNYNEVNTNNMGLYNNINSVKFYSKEEDTSFSRNKKNVHGPYDEIENRLDTRKNSVDFRSSHNYNVDKRNVKHFETDKTSKKYVNNNKKHKINWYHRDTGNYKRSGENIACNKYYNRHGNVRVKNSHEGSYSQFHSFNEHSYGGNGSSDGIYKSIIGYNGSRRSNREFRKGGTSKYEQERVCVDNTNELSEENHSAEFNELRKNLFKYIDTKENNTTEEINESTVPCDKESRKISFEEQTEGSVHSFANKRKISYEDEFSDVSSISNGSRREILADEEFVPDYSTYYHNVGSANNISYGTLNGTMQKDNYYSPNNSYNATSRPNNDLINSSRRNRINVGAQNNKFLNRNTNFNSTWPSMQNNTFEEENLNAIKNGNYINKGHRAHFSYDEDKYNFMNLKSENVSIDTLHNSNNVDLSEEDVFNETEKELLQNNLSWKDEYLFGDNDDSQYNEVDEKSELNDWNQDTDIIYEQRNYQQLSSDINTGNDAEMYNGNTMKYNTSFLQNTYHPAIQIAQGSYNSLNEQLPTKETYYSPHGVYNSIKEKRKEVRFASDYNENMFPKVQIEESLRVLNTLQVDIEKICSYVKHFVDPPEPLFSTMRNVFLENEVPVNSKIAIFYVYNHLIQELRHKYRNNLITYAYISESGLTNFVIPVIKYISERQKNNEVVSKFYRCISIWSDRNIYSKFICDQLIALQKNPNRVIEMNPSNKTSLAHSAVSNEFSKCTPLQFLLQMPSVNNEHIEAKKNEVVNALMENMSKDTLKPFEKETIEEAAKITDKAVRMFGQELILLNTEQMELSVLINDNHEEMTKLLDFIKNLDSVD